jgi:FdhE protein
MRAPEGVLQQLRGRQPEWAPWLAVVEEIQRETASAEWDSAVPESVDLSRVSIPMLAGAAVLLPASSVSRLLDRLLRVAAAARTSKMATLERVRSANLDALTLFRASLCHDVIPVNDAAAASGVDAEALQAIVSLLALPFLHACARRWASSISECWVEGCCPTCGGWPAFAEVRGIERSRHFRCGRCGGQWHARALHCPFCDMTDHDELVSLVPGKSGANAVIEACWRCRGYVKAFTRLQGCAPGVVMLEDLASVDLDVAAIEEGFLRPQGAGYRLDITVQGTGPKRRFFAWNA